MRKELFIPEVFRSDIIKTVKNAQQFLDPRKKNRTPVKLDFGPVQFLIPRHFGFCYGVENALDIAYRTIEEHSGKNIYLLSEIIHNPFVNNDLMNRGVRFLFETDGKERIPVSSLNSDDIVIVPAFGTTVEIQKELKNQGINPYRYDTTCPFVVKVWNRGRRLGEKGYSLVIHGKHQHEETRATFSHTSKQAPCVVVKNPEEARILADIMLKKRPVEDFNTYFGMKCTAGFHPLEDMKRFGVINQTTMLAGETRQVMNILKKAVREAYGNAEEKGTYFAETSDTLCYATHEIQSATLALLEETADLAVVVGGYNSFNTMHLVDLLEKRFPTYHIRDASEILSHNEIHHFNQWDNKIHKTRNWIPRSDQPVTIALTSGASCPDVLVNEVLLEIASCFGECKTVEEVLQPWKEILVK